MPSDWFKGLHLAGERGEAQASCSPVQHYFYHKLQIALITDYYLSFNIGNKIHDF